MPAVPSQFHQLLDATIQYLEDLKARGIRFVPVAPEALAALSGTAHPSGPPAVAPRPGPQARAATPVPEKSPLPSGPHDGAELFALTTSAVNPAVPRPPSLPPAARAQAMAELCERARVCVKCQHLAVSRKNVVFGVGDINAQLMFVGEAPGADEDEQGEPFVGKAGAVLTRIIQTMGLARQSVYIANILKCRPDTPGETAGNRKPTAKEMATCIPYLHEQIDLIQPRVIVALGGTAVEGLLGKTLGITRLRGQWQTYRGIPLLPTFHPAYLLRNQALSERRQLWEDMLKGMEELGLPINEKQRNHFTKP